MSIYNPPSASELEPAGSPTQIQYNLDGVSLGGLDGSSVDDTNQRLGLQVTTPQTPLHVAGTVGSGINNVTIASVVQTAETLPTAPTVTIVQIQEPSAGTGGGGISYIDAGSGTAIPSADGTTYYFRVYPVLVTIDQSGTSYYKAYGYEQLGGTIDPMDGQSYNIEINFGSVTITGESVEYFVEYSTDGASYNPLGRTSTTTTVYTGLSGSDDTVAWPTFYNNTPGIPPNAYTGGSATATNIGFGGLTEVGNTILVEIDSVANILAVNYVSGSPTGGSFDDTGLGTYDAEISWTDNGAATNSITRISQDSGSTWYYQYTSSSTSPYLWTSLTNDPDAEARWGQTYSAGSVTYDFEPYGRGVSASGTQIYGLAGTTYSSTIPADGRNYIFKHQFTGLPAIYGAKILAPQSAPTQGKNIGVVYSDYYDPGYNSWGEGTTVTPDHYGYTGTQQNISYQIYSYNATLGIYGTTPTTVSTTDTGGYKYNTISWTLPAGVDRVKILKNPNGAGYNQGKIVIGSSLIDDLWQSFSDGTTVTPTSIIPETVRFDRANSAVGNTTILGVVGTGGGTVYPKLGFGAANNSSSAAIYYSWLYSPSGTGYIHHVTGRLIVENSAGATPSAYIGGAGNVFNNPNANVDTIIKGINNSNLFQVDASIDSINMGYASQPSDAQASVNIGRVTGADHTLYLDSGGTSNNGNIIQLAASGSLLGGIDAAGRFFIGKTSANTGAWLSIGGSGVVRDQIIFDTNTLPLNNNGSLNYSSDNNWYFVSGGVRKRNVLMATASAGTSTSVAYFDASGFLTSSSNLQFDGTILRPNLIRTADGTAAAPAYNFNNDADNGMYRVTTNNVGFSAGGTLRFDYNATRLLFSDAYNLEFNTTTGTKIGTATTQKLGFFNATPIVQPTGNVLTALQNLGLGASLTIPASSVSSGAALTKTDDTNVTLTLGGSPTTALIAAASITVGWTGTLAESRGGTGVAKSILFDHFANAGNVGTGEDDLYSDTLTAGQFATNGQKIICQYGGTFVGDATSTQRLRMYFGGTLIFDTGALGIGVTTSNWDIYATIIRVSSSVVRCSVTLNTSFATLNAYAQYTEVTGLTLANTQVVKITGEAAGATAATDQIVAREGYIQFLTNA